MVPTRKLSIGSDKTALENLLGKPFTDNLKDFEVQTDIVSPWRILSGTKVRSHKGM